MKISIGSEVFLSKRGMYNFHYPDEEKPLTVTATFSALEMSWVGGGSYCAIRPEDQATAVDEDGNVFRINYPVWIKSEKA